MFIKCFLLPLTKSASVVPAVSWVAAAEENRERRQGGGAKSKNRRQGIHNPKEKLCSVPCCTWNTGLDWILICDSLDVAVAAHESMNMFITFISLAKKKIE